MAFSIREFIHDFDKNQAFKSQRQLRYLSQSILLEESGNLRLIVSASTLICVIVLAFLFWAAIMKIQEITVTIGEVIPSGQIRTIQHLEGGIVDKIYAAEDQEVQKGQRVMTLSPIAVASELDKLHHQETSGMIDAIRLRSLLDNDPKIYSEGIAKITNDNAHWLRNKEHFNKMISDNQSLLTSQIAAQHQAIDVLKRQVAQKKAELAIFTNRESTLKTQVELFQKEKAIYDKLKGSEAISEVTELANRRQLNQAEGDLAQLTSDTLKAKAGVQEAESRLQEAEADNREKILKEMHTVDANLIETRSSIAKLTDRSRRLDINAPVTGIIKGLTLKPGSVIQPGGSLFDVVPLDTDMVVEARISTRDIGHVQVKDPAHVKVTTYEFTRYGYVEGVIDSISASTFVDEKGERYYKAIIRLSQNYVGKQPGKNIITPGMAVVADIVTGKKTLLSYVLKPIYRTVDGAFRER